MDLKKLQFHLACGGHNLDRAHANLIKLTQDDERVRTICAQLALEEGSFIRSRLDVATISLASVLQLHEELVGELAVRRRVMYADRVWAKDNLLGPPCSPNCERLVWQRQRVDECGARSEAPTMVQALRTYKDAVATAANATSEVARRSSISWVVLGLYHVVGVHFGLDTSTACHDAVLATLKRHDPELALTYERLEGLRVAALEDLEADIKQADLVKTLAEADQLLAALRIELVEKGSMRVLQTFTIAPLSGVGLLVERGGGELKDDAPAGLWLDRPADGACWAVCAVARGSLRASLATGDLFTLALHTVAPPRVGDVVMLTEIPSVYLPRDP